MEHNDKVKAIQFIRPNSEFVLRGNELEWLDDDNEQPSEQEIEDGFIAYQAKCEADIAEAAAKRRVLLDRLGITEEEAQLLLS